MPERNEVPTAQNVQVSDLPREMISRSALSGVPTWYLSGLSYTGGTLRFNYVTAIANPYDAGSWWVLWPFSMRDYAYYNSEKKYWNWLPKQQTGVITYNVALSSGQLYTVALFKTGYELADYIEFQA